MNDFASQLLISLGRTTLCLSAAVVVLALALRLMRVTSPTVHRLCWSLALLSGWAFVGWSVEVPWYEPPAEQVQEVASTDNETETSDAEPVAASLLPDGDASELVAVPRWVVPPEAAGDVPIEALAWTEADNAQLVDDAELVEIVPHAGEWPSEMHTAPLPESPIGPPIFAEATPEVVPSEVVEVEREEVASVQPPGVISRMVALVASDWPLLLVGVWLAGMLGVIGAWAMGYLLFLRRIAGRSENRQWQAEWLALLTAYHINARVPLRVTDKLGPMLCRLPRGYELIVPDGLWDELDSDARLAILRHELAHLQRHDVWKSIALRLIALPHWFNPCAWYAARRFDEAAEWACDLAAARDDQPTRYARMLLKLGEGAQRGAAYSPAMSGHALASRIRRLLTPQRPDSALKKILVGLTIMALLVVATLRLQLVAKEPPADERAAATVADTELVEDSELVEVTEITDDSDLVEIEPIAAAQPVDGIQPPVQDESSAAARKLQPLDVLRILVEGTPPESPIFDSFLIEPDGHVVLPAGYGRVPVAGLTRAEAEAAIQQHLQRILSAPEVATSWIGRAVMFSRAIVSENAIRMTPGEWYRVQINGMPPDRSGKSFDQRIQVDLEGRLVLGPGFPAPMVAGMKLSEASDLVTQELATVVSDPQAVITLLDLTQTYVAVYDAGELLPIRPGTYLKIQVEGTPPEHPIDGSFLVHHGGELVLGPAYGRVRVGETTAETAQRIQEHLEKILAQPEVSVSFAGWERNRLTTGQNLAGANAEKREERTESNVVAAAQSAYESVAKAYAIGTTTLDILIEWSERWMNAAFDKAESADEQQRAVAAHLQRMTELRDRIDALHRAKAVGGEADKLAVANFHVEATQRRLTQLSETAAPTPLTRQQNRDRERQRIQAMTQELELEETHEAADARATEQGRDGGEDSPDTFPGPPNAEDQRDPFGDDAPSSDAIQAALRGEPGAESGRLVPIARAITIEGPREAKLGEVVPFHFDVTNTGATSLEDVQIQVLELPELEPVMATDGYLLGENALAWRIDQLPPGRTARIQVHYRCLAPSNDAILSAKLLAEGKPVAQARWRLVIARSDDAVEPTLPAPEHYPPHPMLLPEAPAQAQEIDEFQLPSFAPAEASQEDSLADPDDPFADDTPPAGRKPIFEDDQPPSVERKPMFADDAPSAERATVFPEAGPQPAERKPVFADDAPSAERQDPFGEVKQEPDAIQAAEPDAPDPDQDAPLEAVTPVVRPVVIEGPKQAAVGDVAEFMISITNNTEQTLEEIKIACISSRYGRGVQQPLDPSAELLELVRATDGNQVSEQDELIWHIDQLPPGRSVRLQAHYRCRSAGDAGVWVGVTSKTGDLGRSAALLTVVESADSEQPSAQRASELPDGSPRTFGTQPSVPPPPTATQPVYSGKTFDQWAAILENDLSPDTRAEAIRALTMFAGQGRGKEAARLIVETMRDFDAVSEPPNRVARAAIEVFTPSSPDQASIPRNEATAAAVAALSSDNANQRLFAVEVLYRSFDKRWAKELLGATDDEDARVRRRALEAIRSVDPSVAGFDDALRRALRDQDLDVINSALLQLSPAMGMSSEVTLEREKFKDDLAVAAQTFLEIAQDPAREPFVRFLAINGIAGLGADARNVLEGLNELADSSEAAGQKQMTTMGHTTSRISLAEAAQDAMAAIRGEAPKQPAAARGGGMGGMGAGMMGGGAIGGMGAGMGMGAGAVASPRGMLATQPIYAGKTFAQWAAILENDLSPETRMEALLALRAFGLRDRGADVARLIAHAMRDYDIYTFDGNPEGKLKEAALDALASRDGRTPIARDAALPVMLEASRSEHRNERLFAMHVLHRWGDARGTDALLAATEDEDPQVRIMALGGLQAVDADSPDFKEALRRALGDPDRQVVLWAVMRLVPPTGGAMPGERPDREEFEPELLATIPTLIELAQDERAELRDRVWAVDALGQMGPQAEGVVPALEELARTVPPARRAGGSRGVMGGVNPYELAPAVERALGRLRGEAAGAENGDPAAAQR